ncbi:hypothetical protein L198_06215 [Cryptococcus wingfieldii CBS 7118]|uniref:Uncharacterized protein n=1 Tax=Cryptococcus wingfieldii CBS 7118 TaxID=1295528 RepID=A0A1E3INL8_9TREE|nr:hypothetical protein L198_06215 [Cryptococcus wingfieldii CBS 7118]ODN90197.1 hypothetical protein L198_06215 [Cryptococcus wingfieldii CBS 7118]
MRSIATLFPFSLSVLASPRTPLTYLVPFSTIFTLSVSPHTPLLSLLDEPRLPPPNAAQRNRRTLAGSLPPRSQAAGHRRPNPSPPHSTSFNVACSQRSSSQCANRYGLFPEACVPQTHIRFVQLLLGFHFAHPLPSTSSTMQHSTNSRNWTPALHEWADTLIAFLTHDIPPYINAQVATEVAKQLREERRHVETERDYARHRWMSGVAGVRVGRRSRRAHSHTVFDSPLSPTF